MQGFRVQTLDLKKTKIAGKITRQTNLFKVIFAADRYDEWSDAMKTQNLRTILLTICCVSYLLVGAAIFSALEYEEDQEMRKNMTILHKTLTKKYNISDEDIGKWLQYLDSKANIDADLYQWSFAGSVYFATTVITTIGKG